MFYIIFPTIIIQLLCSCLLIVPFSTLLPSPPPACLCITKFSRNLPTFLCLPLSFSMIPYSFPLTHNHPPICHCNSVLHTYHPFPCHCSFSHHALVTTSLNSPVIPSSVTSHFHSCSCLPHFFKYQPFIFRLPVFRQFVLSAVFLSLYTVLPPRAPYVCYLFHTHHGTTKLS